MKSILIPTDFSDTATNAVFYGAELAHKFGLELVLMHCMHVPVTDVNGSISLLEILMQNEKEASDIKLNKLAQEIKEKFDVHIVILSEFGLAADMIISECETREIDLVVMGTSGASGFLSGLLGSVSSSVARNSEVPVLTVPLLAKFDGLRIMAFAEDHKESSRNELVFIYDFIKKLGSKLDKISVEPESDEYNTEIIFDEGGIREVSVWAETVEEGISTYITNENIDLLVLKHHKRNLFQDLFQKSTTKELLNKNTIPLLIFN